MLVMIRRDDVSRAGGEALEILFELGTFNLGPRFPPERIFPGRFGPTLKNLFLL